MVTVKPKHLSARLLPYVAVGAALGVVVREASASFWPTPAQRWVSVLLCAAVASFALGLMLAVQGRPRLQAVVWGWSGGLCSISVIATLAVDVPAIWALTSIAFVPLSVATGVASGAIVSIRRRQRHETAGEASV